ncbi:MAG: hypothetical protein WAO83_14250 [Fuerstiella sp.]
MTQTRKRISLKSISAERQNLIVCMHEKQFGTIRHLPVVDGEPQLKNAKVVRMRKLTNQNNSKPVSPNYYLKVAQLRLLDTLDEIHDGELEQITFRHGLPFELKESTS